MILKESEIDQDTITAVLGKPYKKPGKVFTPTGSSFYFVRDFTDLEGNPVLKWDDSKAIFQRFENGLAVYANRSNYQRVVLIPFENLRAVRLEQFIEYDNNNSREPTLVRLLNGLKKLIQSLFGLPANVRSRETVLEFSSERYKGLFITSYSSFKSEKKYFNDLGLGERLTIEKSD